MATELQWAKSNLDKLTAFRRELHRYPEPSCKEIETHRRLRAWLREMDVAFFTPENNITIAVLGEKLAGAPCVGIRCDTDALEVKEQTCLPFQSRHEGVMHACGHDAHMAMGLGACLYWKTHPEALQGRVKVIFQPAEEGGDGAEHTVGTGLLDDVDAFIALHVWPQLDKGVISITDGPVCSSTDIVSIRVYGKGGHGAYPDLCQDAVAASAAVVTALQHIVSRFVPPIQPVVLSLGSLHAGTRWNVIAQEAAIEGTLRTFDDGLRERIIERMRSVIEHTAAAHQCSAELEITSQAKVVFNDPALSSVLRSAALELFPAEKVLALAPAMIGDDFSAYRTIAPCCYGLLGVRKQGDLDAAPLHHGAFDIDEEALALGTAYFCHAAARIHQGVRP